MHRTWYAKGVGPDAGAVADTVPRPGPGPAVRVTPVGGGGGVGDGLDTYVNRPAPVSVRVP
jgi:hypothetical protein